MGEYVICKCKEEEISRIEIIKDIISKNYSRCYIYGAGKRGNDFYNWIRCFIVSNVGGVIDRANITIGELRLISPEEITNEMIVFVTPLECDSIIEYLESRGLINNENFFDLREYCIPVLANKNIQLNENTFDVIKTYLNDVHNNCPIPIFKDGIICDYYCARTELGMYKIILDELNKTELNEKTKNCFNWNDKNVGLTSYNSISDKVIDFLKNNGINVGYVYKPRSVYERKRIEKKLLDSENADYLFGDSYSFLNEIDIINSVFNCEEYFIDLVNKGINIYLLRIPNNDELSLLSSDEKFRYDHNITGYTREDEYQLKKVYADEFDLYCKREIGILTQSFNGNYILLNDYDGTYTNVIGGERLTMYQPENSEGNVYMYGPCTVGSAYTSDQYTIPSIIQKLLINDGINIKIINKGILGGLRRYIEKIREIELYEGDYLLLMDEFPKKVFDNIDEKIKKIDLLEIYNSRPNDIFFEKTTHLGYLGNKYLGGEIYKKIEWQIKKDRRVIQSFSKQETAKIDYIQNNINKLLGSVHLFNKGRTGSIVMNCNPFTYGHQYLIENALKYCDYLYIFVVEENLSFFDFSLRYEMIKKACEKYENVQVIPSGKIILSKDTMPEYFCKEDIQGVSIDTSYDINIFARYVCPAMNIAVRFVGEEPIDLITRQYNQKMKEILPDYNVEVIEIPRQKKFNQFISASEVRRLIKEKNYEKIKELVPQTTYQIISRMW